MPPVSGWNASPFRAPGTPPDSVQNFSAWSLRCESWGWGEGVAPLVLWAQVSPGCGSVGLCWVGLLACACCAVRWAWHGVQRPRPLVSWCVPPSAGLVMWSASVLGRVHPCGVQMGQLGQRHVGSRWRMRRRVGGGNPGEVCGPHAIGFTSPGEKQRTPPAPTGRALLRRARSSSVRLPTV